MSKPPPPTDDDGWIDPPAPLREDELLASRKGFLTLPYAKKTKAAQKDTTSTNEEPETEEDIDPFSPPSGSWFTKQASKQLDKKIWRSILRGGLIKIDPILLDTVPDEEKENARISRLYTIIQGEALMIAGLSLLLVLALPFGAPLYRYYARTENQPLEEAHRNAMIALNIPNLTNRAILSWAATSVAEIMTFGFGDFETKLKQQKPRFTDPGWAGFVKEFIEKQVGEQFQQRQLVVTTAPADTPVIVSQGENKENIYEWHVQAPVIITFATNNNVTSSARAIVGMTIVRVPHEHNASGIAINSWRQTKG
ncbi:MAG: DotI/IcmL family type IV secretion protein [Bdellovibrionales bacterium]